MLPEKPWKSESVARLMLGILGTLCIGVLVVGAVAYFKPGLSEGNAKLLSMLIITLAFHGAALLWIRSFLKTENISWIEAFGFDAPRKARAVVLGVLSSILVLPVAWGLQRLSVWIMTLMTDRTPVSQEVVQELQKESTSLIQQIYLGFVALIAAPIVEEIVFRGILYPTIKQAGYPKLALWGTSILFSLTHHNAVAFLPLMFFAMILALLYEETGNLLAPIIAHASFNTANFVLLLLAKQFSQF